MYVVVEETGDSYLEPEDPDLAPQGVFSLEAELRLLEIGGKAALAALPKAEPVTDLRRAAVSERSAEIKQQQIRKVEEMAKEGKTESLQERRQYVLH